MADNQTTLTINIDTLLRGLERTLRGLKQVEQQLKRTAGVTGGAQTAGINRATAATQRLQVQQQRAALSSQRLAQQQQALDIRAQRLANAQTRVQQTTQRLVVAQQRLDQATANTTRNLGQQADAHVKAFRAIETASRRATQNILGVGNALRSVGQGLASLGATLSVAVTAPLVAAGTASVDAAVRLDSLKRGLTAIVGSADEANRQLARLTQIAKLPGIGFEEAIQGSIRLQAVGFSAKEAETSLREFANAVALTGGGRDELTRVTVQLGQLAAKGKVLSQDLRPIIEAAPAVGRALLQAFGTVNAADIQELGLSSKEFLNTLTDELSRLPRAAAGAKNSFENFRDEVFRAAAAVGEALLPGLIRLAEVVGPVITRLADTFAKLPQPVQLVAIGVGLLAAALGPVLFVVGQLTLGVGRLLVGFVELNAAGIIPSIASMRAYAAAALQAAAASKTLGVSTVGLGAGLGLLVNALAAVVIGYQLYSAFQKDAVTLSEEQATALTAEIDKLEEQAHFLAALKTGVERTADEQERLLEIYGELNIEAKVRLTSITDEEKRLVALRAELEKLIQLRERERAQAAARIAGELANSVNLAEVNQRERDSIAQRIQQNTALIETLEREGVITAEVSRALAQRGINASTAEEAIGGLKTESQSLSETQDELIKSGQELNGKVQEQAKVLRVLEQQTGLTARELLTAAKALGVFRGDVDATIKLLEHYVQQTDEATKATDAFSRALAQQTSDLLKAGDSADAIAKSRNALIDAAASLSREASDSFEGALKFMQAFIAAQPELRRAIEREAQLRGKTFQTVIDEEIQKAFKGRDKNKSGTALRNAQEQLAKTLTEIALASAEQQGAIEKQKNDRLLQENENAFKLNLRSLHLYLSERASLIKDNLQLEINEQKALVDAAIAEQQRFLARAGKAGIPAAEKTKAQAGANAAQEKAIKAQTKILELTDKQRQADADANQELAEHKRQQVADLRQLEVQYGELRGRIEDALNAATDEKFRDVLQQLALDQETLNKRIRAATANRRADELEELQVARDRNQAQIDAIQGIITQERALNQLAAAEELVRRAKERQSQLEDDLQFQVEHRGLTENEAIRQRLAGEQKLADSLRLSRDVIQDTITALEARGVKPPQALIEFVRNLRTEIQGLGELSFTEQFQIVEREFDRLNDERLRRIADVERAVRNRDIAEAEGLLLIRRINGLYVGDLERQLALLKQIAADSHNPDLQRQAQQAEETAKDAADQLATLDQQIRSTSIDALRDGFTEFFLDLTDQSESALQDLLKFVNGLARRINEVIADNLSRKLVESLFGGSTATAGGGLIAGIKRLFGFGGGGQGGVGAAGSAASAITGATQQTAATTAAATLQAGAATAAATETASAVSFATAITAAATAFASAVAAAGAAFAASVSASSATKLIDSGSGIGSFATGDILPARPGGRLVRVAEGGHAEAVLTTDPQQALRQSRLLSRFLRMTRGLQGRFPVPELASGALVTPRQAEADLLSGIARTPLSIGNIADLPLASAGGGTVRLRQVLTDERDVGNWMNSSEGERVFRDKLIRNAPVIRQLGGGR